jgi:ATPase family associated with various cellular activities (AAA)
LQSIAGDKKLMPLPTAKNATVGDSYVYYTESLDAVTVDMYRRLAETASTAVVINPDKPSPLVFEAGILPTPPAFFVEYLRHFVHESKIPGLVQVLKGLSLKTGQEVVQLTMARTGSVLPQEVRRTRTMLRGETPGLYSLDTDYDFYEMPKLLKQWIDLNDKYFLDPTTPQRLMPRGLLLSGDPGVGKSMASMVLAKHWDVPLFRLDISTSLNRYLGESESRIARNLSIIENNAPCIWLLLKH